MDAGLIESPNCPISRRPRWAYDLPMRLILSLLFTLQMLCAQPQTAPIIDDSIPSANLLAIDGSHFGTAPSVTLDGNPVTISSSSDTMIVVQIPPGLSPGSYRLVVTNGQTHQTGSSTATI